MKAWTDCLYLFKEENAKEEDYEEEGWAFHNQVLTASRKRKVKHHQILKEEENLYNTPSVD